MDETGSLRRKATFADDPLVMGYYYGFGAFNHSQNWVNHHLSLKPNSPGRNAVVDVLRQRYGNDVQTFNRVYGTELAHIEDLKHTVVLSYDSAFENRNFEATRKTLHPQQLADFEAILSHMCVTLYKFGHNAIRRWDTNHLILGSYVKEWALTGESWKAAAPYIDMISPQHLSREISLNELADVAELPILVSDDYFGFHYPNLGTGHAAVVSHDARAEIYPLNLIRHLKDRQVLGVTYCAAIYDQADNELTQDQQNGFYDVQGTPRAHLIQVVTETNKSIYMHSPHPSTAEELQSLQRELFETWDKYNCGDW